jgi:hypothetical protein
MSKLSWSADYADFSDLIFLILNIWEDISGYIRLYLP